MISALCTWSFHNSLMLLELNIPVRPKLTVSFQTFFCLIDGAKLRPFHKPYVNPTKKSAAQCFGNRN